MTHELFLQGFFIYKKKVILEEFFSEDVLFYKKLFEKIYFLD